LEKAISEAKHTLKTVTLTRQDAQAELTDFIRTRTELECTIEDLRAADANAGGKREELERELEQVEQKIAEKEETLNELTPEWTAQRALEATEKRKLDEASARLASLFAKQGRATKFRTKGERDAFLKGEIASLKAFQKTQGAALESTRAELEAARQGIGEIDTQIAGVYNKIEDGKQRVRELNEQAVGLKDQHNEFAERRKDLWREDTKLDSLVGRAADELRTAERALAGMMDKVSFLIPLSHVLR
jgi:structural maintenance of chromosome 3 (chondroitin sulfate proteoglycan 6)